MEMESSSKSVWVGFITYGSLTAPYVSYFLQSLRQQTYTHLHLVCFDNTPEVENSNTQELRNFPEVVVYRRTGNQGFSAAYNILLAEASRAGAEYFLIINPDTVLEPEAIEYLLIELETQPQTAVAVPKLRRWNFLAHTRTKTIDSCGLRLTEALQFRDIGQGEEDHNQYDHEEIFGASGAAGLFRLSALEKIKVGNQYFDEAFFMYKEDCDLAYRLYIAGFSARLVSRAIIYHDRTAVGGSWWRRFINRRQRSRAANRYAFINQHFLYFKYWRLQTFTGKFKIILEASLQALHALIFEPYLLSCYSIISKARHQLKKY